METKKGIYVDGHERPDVVLDRQTRFIPEIERILEECVSVNEESDGTIVLVNESAPFLLVNEDEKAHKSNERPVWYVKCYIYWVMYMYHEHKFTSTMYWDI